ncbi:hypothetical protein LCGC14_0346470 [marine sediment metagenome]|uniref:Uncharacterized protein n=1 Tax=marine sediment metagenome TaxID=412755 RepID=A0A0F9TCB0_9ZZZZ
MQGVHLRKYGVAATVDFELYEVDGVDFRTDWTPAAGDVFMMRDEAAEEQVTNAAGNADLSTLVTDEGRAYSITLALEDMQAARVVVYLVDQATKAFLDKSLVIETYGNASAQHAFDLDTASVAQSADNDTILSSINIANGAVESDLTFIHGSALTETAGQLAAAFKKLFDVATPLLVASDVMVGTDSAALASVLGAAVGATISADIADIPTVAEFNARTIVSADYVVVGDTIAGVTNAGTVTGNVDGSVASVTAGVTLGADAITAAKIADNAFSAEHFATDSITTDAVKSDALNKIVMSDLATGAPSVTASLPVALNWLYEAFRNKTETTATLITLKKDDGSTDLAKATISDAAGTTTKEEFVSG